MREVPSRVYIFGIDAASWAVFDRVMALGAMPNLQDMVNEGAHGVLRSMEPTASAVIWTTIATGKVPAKHGIHGFTAMTRDGKRVPVTSNLRKVKAVWDIAGEAGVPVGFLAWWVTWPAEPVKGFLASDYTWPLAKSTRGFATGSQPDLRLPSRTFPAGLMDELQPMIETEQNTSDGELAALGILDIPETEGYAVRDMMLKDVSVGAMSAYLLDRYDPSLYGVYFDGYDAYCHIYWPLLKNYLGGELSGDAAHASAGSAEEKEQTEIRRRARKVAEALIKHLRRIDGYLGVVRRHARPQDVVMVISDHGYGDNPGRKPIQRPDGTEIRPPHWHTLKGIFAAAGGPVRRGVEINGASVLDVVPTTLHLLGLPVARDMDGEVLEGILEDGYHEEHPVEWVETYETGERGSDEPIESTYDQDVMDRLRALGYID